MRNTLLCLNSEWQGCESSILQNGSKKLARELFKGETYTDIQGAEARSLARSEGVFALDFIGKQFVNTLELLQKESPQRVMTVGGTCGVDAAPVSYLNSRYEGDLAVIWFDAHGDLNTPDTSPSGHFHGMVLRTLLGDGPQIYCGNIERFLRPEQVFLAGVRDLDLTEQDYIDRSNLRVYDVNESLTDVVHKSGFSNVYIHLDVDVINPEDFSDALMPTRDGPTRKQISSCISAMNEQLDIVGLSVVEYCGAHENSTEQLAKMLAAAGLTNSRI